MNGGVHSRVPGNSWSWSSNLSVGMRSLRWATFRVLRGIVYGLGCGSAIWLALVLVILALHQSQGVTYSK